MAGNNTIFNCEGTLIINLLDITGAALNAGATTQLLVTKAVVQVNDVGGEPVFLKDPYNVNIARGDASTEKEINIENMDLEPFVKAQLDGAVYTTASNINTYTITSVYSNFSGTSSTALATLIAGTALIANPTTAIVGNYIVRRSAGATGLIYYLINGSNIRTILPSTIFATPPVVTGTDEIYVVFQVQSPLTEVVKWNSSILQAYRDPDWQVLFIGKINQGQTSPSFYAPWCAPMQRQNLDLQNLQFAKYNLKFKVMANNITFNEFVQPYQIPTNVLP